MSELPGGGAFHFVLETYPNLDTHVPRLRKEGVKILEDIHKWGDTRAAMIEDLDGLAIMLIERKEP